jgi:hypothetical protein
MDSRLLQADELGVCLGIVAGLPIWEAQPVSRHQKAINRIRASIATVDEAGCGCIHVAEVHVRRDGVAHPVSPVTITFDCGCVVSV